MSRECDSAAENLSHLEGRSDNLYRAFASATLPLSISELILILAYFISRRSKCYVLEILRKLSPPAQFPPIPFSLFLLLFNRSSPSHPRQFLHIIPRRRFSSPIIHILEAILYIYIARYWPHRAR